MGDIKTLDELIIDISDRIREWQKAAKPVETSEAVKIGMQLDGLAFVSVSSAETLQALTGIPDIVYRYVLPARYTPAEFSLIEVHNNLTISSRVNEWRAASNILERVTPEEMQRYRIDYNKLSTRQGKSAWDLIDEIIALNPEAGLEKIAIDRADYKDAWSMLMGVSSHYHPDDLAYFFSHYSLSARQERFRDMTPNLAPMSADIGKICSQAISNFMLSSGYMLSSASKQKLETGFREQGVAIDKESITTAVLGNLAPKLECVSPEVAASLYMSSFSGFYTAVTALEESRKNSKPPGDIDERIKGCSEWHRYFVSLLFQAQQKQGHVRQTEESLYQITATARRVGIEENALVRLETKWQQDRKLNCG